jgi:hypothetical protein
MFKILIVCLFLSAHVSSQVKFSEYFLRKTLRIDFIEAGNSSASEIIFQQMKQEPFWSGPELTTDTFTLGEYHYLAMDSVSGKVIFEKGYSNLFYEWSSTSDANTTSKSFYEVLTMPFPIKTILFEIRKRNKQLDFVSVFKMYINPNDRFLNKENPINYAWNYIEKNGNAENKTDIVIVPDGYSANDSSKFIYDAKRITEYLFNSSPFKENRKEFNIISVQAWSEESGTDNPGINIWKNTLLETSFYTFNTERYLTVNNIKKMRDVASVTPYDFIIVLVNSNKYGGGGFYNNFCCLSSGSSETEFLFIHEFGHTYAGLGDEYYSSDVAVEDFYPLNKEPWEWNLTTLVDFQNKWKDKLKKGTPVPTPSNQSLKYKIGVFEGGGYVEKGVYRPSFDCTMKSVSVDNFCEVCKDAIQTIVNYYSH